MNRYGRLLRGGLVPLLLCSGCGTYGSAISVGAMSGMLPGLVRRPTPEYVDPLRETLALLQANYVEPIQPAQLIRPMLRKLKEDAAPDLIVDESSPSLVRVSCGGGTAEVSEAGLDADAFVSQTRRLESTVAPCISPGALADVEDYRHAVVRATLESLDSESAFFGRLPSGGEAGVGLELTKRQGSITVFDTFENYPAARAGIDTGDQILTIDGVDAGMLSLPGVIEKLRGPKGSLVALTIERNGWTAPREFRLRREIIHLFDVKGRALDGGTVGYVKVRQFSETTVEQVRGALDGLRPISSLVVDLRNNPGGLLAGAISFAGLFLPKGLVVTTIEERIKRTDTRGESIPSANGFLTRYRSQEDEPVLDLPIVVLVSHGTAAGAEIVADALQRYRRATIFGTTTFGRDSVRSRYTLADGTVIMFTTGRIYRTAGLPLASNPIVPDVPIATDGNISGDLTLERALRWLHTGQ